MSMCCKMFDKVAAGQKCFCCDLCLQTHPAFQTRSHPDKACLKAHAGSRRTGSCLSYGCSCCPSFVLKANRLCAQENACVSVEWCFCWIKPTSPPMMRLRLISTLFCTWWQASACSPPAEICIIRRNTRQMQTATGLE